MIILPLIHDRQRRASMPDKVFTVFTAGSSRCEQRNPLIGLIV